MIAAAERDDCFPVHQVDEVMEARLSDLEMIAAVKPVQRRDHVLCPGQLAVEDFGDFARTGDHGPRYSIGVDVGVRHQLWTQTLPSTRSHLSSSGVPSRMCV